MGQASRTPRTWGHRRAQCRRDPYPGRRCVDTGHPTGWSTPAPEGQGQGRESRSGRAGQRGRGDTRRDGDAGHGRARSSSRSDAASTGSPHQDPDRSSDARSRSVDRRRDSTRPRSRRHPVTPLRADDAHRDASERNASMSALRNRNAPRRPGSFRSGVRDPFATHRDTVEVPTPRRSHTSEVVSSSSLAMWGILAHWETNVKGKFSETYGQRCPMAVR